MNKNVDSYETYKLQHIINCVNLNYQIFLFKS